MFWSTWFSLLHRRTLFIGAVKSDRFSFFTDLCSGPTLVLASLLIKKLTISKDNGLIEGQSGAHLEGEGDGGLVDGRRVEQVLDYHLDVLVRPQSDLLHFHIICPICRLGLKRIVKVFLLKLILCFNEPSFQQF